MKRLVMLPVLGVLLALLQGAACSGSEQELQDARAQLEMQAEIIRQNNSKFVELENENGELAEQLRVAKTQAPKPALEVQKLQRQLAKMTAERDALSSQIKTKDEQIAKKDAKIDELRATPAGQQTELVNALRGQVAAYRELAEQRRRRLISLGHQAKRIHIQAKNGKIDTKRTRYMYRYAASIGQKVQDAKDKVLHADTRVELLTKKKPADDIAVGVAINETALKTERQKKWRWYHKAKRCEGKLQTLAANASAENGRTSEISPEKTNELRTEVEKLRTEIEKLRKENRDLQGQAPLKDANADLSPNERIRALKTKLGRAELDLQEEQRKNGEASRKWRGAQRFIAQCKNRQAYKAGKEDGEVTCNTKVRSLTQKKLELESKLASSASECAKKIGTSQSDLKKQVTLTYRYHKNWKDESASHDETKAALAKAEAKLRKHARVKRQTPKKVGKKVLRQRISPAQDFGNLDGAREKPFADEQIVLKHPDMMRRW